MDPALNAINAIKLSEPTEAAIIQLADPPSILMCHMNASVLQNMGRGPSRLTVEREKRALLAPVGAAEGHVGDDRVGCGSTGAPARR